MAMTPRLLVDGLHEAGQAIALDRDQAHYAQRVLRLRAGDTLQVFDGQGARWSAVLAGEGREPARIELREPLPALPESPLRLTLVQCISSAERMDFTLEKAVELGVAVIAPVSSARSVVKLDDDRARKRLTHWQRLMVAACMQCGRDTVPPVLAPQPLAAWLAQRPAGRTGWVLSPLAAQSLARVALAAVPPASASGTQTDRLPSGREADLLIGPESGLTEDEIHLATQAGMTPVRLGPRVLRTETAGLAALSLLQVLLGDLG